MTDAVSESCCSFTAPSGSPPLKEMFLKLFTSSESKWSGSQGGRSVSDRVRSDHWYVDRVDDQLLFRSKNGQLFL